MIYLGIFFLGLQLGATACAISCMPVMSPILLANGENKTKAFAILSQFFGAKIVAYTTISIFGFLGAGIVKTMVDEVFFSQALGVVIIFLGFTLFLSSLKSNNNCNTSCTNSKLSTSSYLAIGFLSSFSVCTPLISLVLFSSSANSLYISMAYGLSFGLGVVLIPFLFFYFFIFQISSGITKELYKYKQHIQVFASILLILIGFLVYFGYLSL
ncbi:sulfite exporter TauE/SafE family protein [Arcobacter sp. FWKO B]|uniref:urease accessory protein UreH domain-containing protein n=1 Tax=Arcobacter sp. FWKO B TaxID=2593672 RepID=UPI0018A58284|nr:sulfite exporter TauE/SafE family protein [Arcobacter sp. FWKO B]QOG11405.1 sulfite exporter TauE/SafE family protein [Arcobacter sp. FWKO B]